MTEYLSLYRKYRPKTFDEVVGQEHVVGTLQNQVKNKTMAHAYLFTGARGTGKTSCAKILAKAVNCINNNNGSPCLECEVCKALQSTNINVVEIDAASNNSVEDVRVMRENIKFAPVGTKYKVYIIDEVHMLSVNAFNALLKSIEEPPAHIIFILATTEVHKIPATILSRVVRLDFKLVDYNVLCTHLKNIFDKEGIKAEQIAIEELARLSEGSVRDMLSLAECVTGYARNDIKLEHVLECMGTNSKAVLLELVKVIAEGELGRFFELVNDFYVSGKNFALLTKELVGLLRDLIICKTVKNAKNIVRVNEQEYNTFKQYSENYTIEQLFKIMSEFVKREGEFRYAASAKILFESIGIVSMEDALKKNDDLEEEVQTNKLVSYEDMDKVQNIHSSKSGISVWGQITTKVSERGDIALASLCTTIDKADIDDKRLTIYTDRIGFKMNFQKCGYVDVINSIIKQLDLGVEFDIVEIDDNDMYLTKEQRNVKKLKTLFGNYLQID